MIIETGNKAEKIVKYAKHYVPTPTDPEVYDYAINYGVVTIHRNTGECTYLKSGYTQKGAAYIAMRGMPEEFGKHKQTIEDVFDEAKIVNWEEIEEMVRWAPKVQGL